MPSENKKDEKKPAEDQEPEDIDERINTVVNRAITSHLQRFEKKLGASLEKTVGDAVAKIAPPKDDVDTDGKQKGKDAPAPAVPPEWQKRLDVLEKRAAEAERRAKDTETRAKRDAVRATLREQIEAAGIKGARARAVLADLEASGVLRYDPETGEPSMAVKRSRAKGATPEEQSFEDLVEGVKDWLKGPDAQEFLPAPAGPPKRPGASASAPAGTAARKEGSPPPSPTTSEDEALRRTVQQLADKGVDFNDW